MQLVDNGRVNIADYAPGGPLYNPNWRQQQLQRHSPLSHQFLGLADADQTAIYFDEQQQQQQYAMPEQYEVNPAMGYLAAQQQKQLPGRISSSSGGSSLTAAAGVVGVRLAVKCGTAHGLFDLAR